MNRKNKASDKQEKDNDFLYNDSHCGLTENEYTERKRLLELQSNKTRWFSQEEFNRLKKLSNKMYKKEHKD